MAEKIQMQTVNSDGSLKNELNPVTVADAVSFPDGQSLQAKAENGSLVTHKVVSDFNVDCIPSNIAGGISSPSFIFFEAADDAENGPITNASTSGYIIIQDNGLVNVWAQQSSGIISPTLTNWYFRTYKDGIWTEWVLQPTRAELDLYKGYIDNDRRADILLLSTTSPYFTNATTFRWIGGTIGYVSLKGSGQRVTAGINLTFSAGAFILFDTSTSAFSVSPSYPADATVFVVGGFEYKDNKPTAYIRGLGTFTWETDLYAVEANSLSVAAQSYSDNSSSFVQSDLTSIARMGGTATTITDGKLTITRGVSQQIYYEISGVVRINFTTSGSGSCELQIYEEDSDTVVWQSPVISNPNSSGTISIQVPVGTIFNSTAGATATFSFRTKGSDYDIASENYSSNIIIKRYNWGVSSS